MGEMKSTHELRNERLQKKIKEIENQAINEKPWQMTGEVAAIERPDNALLEEHLDFDTVSKQAPIITEEVLFPKFLTFFHFFQINSLFKKSF